MTRLVAERDMVDLYNRLNELERIAERVREEADSDKELAYKVGYARGAARSMHETIHSLRNRILQWAKLRPLADGTEIIESKVVGECATHGLFFDDYRGNAVVESDCPTCMQDEDDREDDRAQEAGDARHDARVDEQGENDLQATAQMEALDAKFDMLEYKEEK